MALFKSGFSQQDLAQMEPDDIQRKRKLAEALLAQGADTSPIAHPLQGLARIAQALSGKFQDYRLDKAQSAGRESANADFASLMGGGSASGGDGRFTAADLPSAGGSGGYSSASASSSGPRGSSANVGDPKIFDTFMSTVKEGGLTNPFGLAAVAATGKHESGFSPKNVSGSWSDPSESGRPGTAGGAMSWNNERFAAMRNFVQAGKKADPNADEVRLQAQYFLREDPELIARLNTAKSPEEAQQLMNNAWRFAGYNRPGGEASRRMATAAQFAKRFASEGQGGQAPVQVASLDPSAGMGAAPAAPVQAAPPVQQPPPQMTPPAPMPTAPQPPSPPVPPQAPGTMPQQDTLAVPPVPVGAGQVPAGTGGGQPVLDVTNSPSLSSAPGMSFAPSQPGTYTSPKLAEALIGGGGAPAPAPAPGQLSPQGMVAHDRAFGGALAPGGNTPNPQALAAALQGGGTGMNYFPPAPGVASPGGRQGFPPAPPPPGQGGGGGMPSMEVIQRVLNNPHATQAQKAMAMQAYEQIQKRSDPAYQLQMTQAEQEIEKNRLAIEAAKNPAQKFEFITGKDGAIFRADPKTGALEPVYGGGGNRFKQLTKEEIAQRGLDPNKAYQVGPDDKIYQVGGEGTTVNIDQKSEGEFEKQNAKNQSEFFTQLAKDGQSAKADLAVVEELGTALAGAGEGGFTGGLRAAAARYGIGGENMDDIQVADALIEKLIPTQRPPGSGSMSDRDVEMFKASLPSLWKLPDANTRILGIMQGLAQYRADQGDIAFQIITDQLDRKEGLKALNALPNPLAAFRKSREKTKVEIAPGYTIQPADDD